MTVERQSSDALPAPRSTPLPDGSSAGAVFACYSRLKTAGPYLRLEGIDPAGMAKEKAGALSASLSKPTAFSC